jgi:hypothetical protein
MDHLPDCYDTPLWPSLSTVLNNKLTRETESLPGSH